MACNIPRGCSSAVITGAAATLRVNSAKMRLLGYPVGTSADMQYNRVTL